ncbi:hypothetical protein ACLKA6_016883 [Drosophila palustris]
MRILLVSEYSTAQPTATSTSLARLAKMNREYTAPPTTLTPTPTVLHCHLTSACNLSVCLSGFCAGICVMHLAALGTLGFHMNGRKGCTRETSQLGGLLVCAPERDNAPVSERLVSST